MVVAHEHAPHVRHHEAHPSHDAAHRHRGRGEQRGHHDRHHAQAPHVDAERPGLLLVEGEQVELPPQRDEHQDARQRNRSLNGQFAVARVRHAAHEPRGDHGELGVGVGDVLDDRGERVEERGHDDAGQHEHVELGPPLHAPHHDHQGHRDEAEAEREPLDDEDRPRDEDAERRAESRAARDAQDVGRDERVAEDSLERAAGRREGPAHEDRHEDAGEADRLHDVDLDGVEVGDVAGEQAEHDLDRLEGRDLVTPQADGEEQAQHEEHRQPHVHEAAARHPRAGAPQLAHRGHGAGGGHPALRYT